MHSEGYGSCRVCLSVCLLPDISLHKPSNPSTNNSTYSWRENQVNKLICKWKVLKCKPSAETHMKSWGRPTDVHCLLWKAADEVSKELKTWQMHSERCASLGSMLTLSAAFHRRLCRSVFLNFAYMEPFSSEHACLRRGFALYFFYLCWHKLEATDISTYVFNKCLLKMCFYVCLDC